MPREEALALDKQHPDGIAPGLCSLSVDSLAPFLQKEGDHALSFIYPSLEPAYFIVETALLTLGLKPGWNSTCWMFTSI